MGNGSKSVRVQRASWQDFNSICTFRRRLRTGSLVICEPRSEIGLNLGGDDRKGGTPDKSMWEKWGQQSPGNN